MLQACGREDICEMLYHVVKSQVPGKQVKDLCEPVAVKHD